MVRRLGSFEQGTVYSTQAGAFHIVVCLKLSPLPDQAALSKAFKIVQQEEPMLRAFVKWSKLSFQFKRETALAIKEIYREDDDHWRRILTEELNTVLPHDSPPLLRAARLEKDGEGELVLSISTASPTAAR